ncbi:MAG: translation initiation factor IF-2 [Myxococcales bacterium]|nr:translation initiation factor IF-2 [Myxococcales bacterium]
MNKVRVYEVARQLGMSNRDLVALFQSLGVAEVRNHMSSVEAEAVERVKRKLERQKSPQSVEEHIRPTVVKRRSRQADVPAARPSEAGEVAVPAPSAPGDRLSQPGAVARAPRESEPAAERAALEHVELAPVSHFEAPPTQRVAPTVVAEPAPAVEPVAVVAARPASEPPIHDAPVEAAPQASPPESAPAPELAAASEPSAPAPEAPGAQAEPAAARVAEDTASVARRPSQPPKTGIEVWAGRAGVPMPQRPRPAAAPPSARRTTYDPRANAAAGARQPYAGGYGQRPGMPGRPGMRPGFARPRPGMPQRRGPVSVSTKAMSADKMVIKIEGETSLHGLAAKMSLKATEVLMRLLQMGMTGVNINSTLDVDTAKLLAGEFGWTVEDVSIDEETSLEAGAEGEGEEGEGAPRAPVVTVMGHVDHGKTTLLDTIRKTHVAASEAGGITQHIGAYRVETQRGPVCFLDTPGHEAFTAMRARGAQVTDLVVLVVAADDGVMPQTREAISHARSAKVPIIVAVNKCDKPGVDPERIMRDLASEGLQPEEWGGDTIFCRVSALNGMGVQQLLEMIAIQSEMLELLANPGKRAKGVVVEALLDRGRGPVARVLVEDGTLRTGDVLLAGRAYGKVRAMTDELGRPVAEAGPSTPVEVLGLNEVPQAGDPVHALKDLRTAETIAGDRKKKVTGTTQRADARVSLEALTKIISEGEQLELKVIIKADVHGSVEALVHALTKLSTPKVKLSVVHTGVGAITETDVNLAVASKAIIIGFNVRPAGKAKKIAETEGIEIRHYGIIYEAIDDVRAAMEGLLPAAKIEKELGKAEVRQVFRISKVGQVAGCMVVQGLIKRSADIRVIRDSVVVWTGKLSGLRRFKEDTREVREGFECGISLDNFADVKEGDVIECFEIEEVKAKL